MKVNFRALSEKDSDLLCELFRSQAKEADAWIWQDRSPQFFALYDAMKKGASPFNYFGGFNENGKLIASSGAVTTEMRWAGHRKRFQYETDYFVEEHSRSKRVGWDLLETRLEKTYAPKGEFSSSVFLAVENQPGLFSSAFEALWKKHHGDMVFPTESRLHEIYLLPADSRSSPQKKIETLSIQSASTSELDLFIAGYDRFHAKSVLAPFLEKETLRALSEQFKNAKLYLAFDGPTEVAGALVLDLSAARRFVWTGKPSLIQTRLRQTRSLDVSEFATGAPFKNLIISFVWHEPGQQSALFPLFDRIYQDAIALGYHALIARDLNETTLKLYEDQTLNYSRRIVLTIREEDRESHEIVQAALANGSRWTLEPVFL